MNKVDLNIYKDNEKYVLFPIKENKEPLVKGWESLTNSVILDGYSHGLLPRNGLICIDVDVKNNAKGIESIKKLSEAIGVDLLEYKSVITQSGGYHIYLNSNLDSSELKRYYRGYQGIEFIQQPRGYAVYIHPKYKIVKDVNEVIKEDHTEIIQKILNHFKQLSEVQNLENSLRAKKATTYDLETLSDILSYCDADSEYNDWIRITGAFKSACQNNPNIDLNEAFEVFKEWSQSATNYNDSEDNLRYKWEKAPIDSLSIGTLIYYAKEGGFDVRELHYKLLEDNLGLHSLDMDIYDLVPKKVRVLNEDNKYEWIENPLLENLETLESALSEIKERMYYTGSHLVILAKNLSKITEKKVSITNLPKILKQELDRKGRFKNLFYNGTPLVKLEMLASFITEINPVNEVIKKDSWKTTKELKKGVLSVYNERKYNISIDELEANKEIFNKFLTHWQGNYEKIVKLHMITNKLNIKKGKDIAIIAKSGFGKTESFKLLQNISFNSFIPLTDLVKNGSEINNIAISEYMTHQIILDEKNYYHRGLFDITDSMIYRGMYKTGFRINIPNKVFLMADSGAFGNQYQDSQIINRVILLNYGNTDSKIEDILKLHPYSTDIITYHLAKLVREFEGYIESTSRQDLYNEMEKLTKELKEFNKTVDSEINVEVVNFEDGVKEVLREFVNNPYETQRELQISNDKLIVTDKGVYLRNASKYLKAIIESINAELADELKFKNLRDLISKIGLVNKAYRVGDKVVRALFIPKDL